MKAGQPECGLIRVIGMPLPGIMKGDEDKESLRHRALFYDTLGQNKTFAPNGVLPYARIDPVNTTYLYSLIPTLAFYGLSFFAPNNKVFVILFVLYGLVMWMIHKRWKNALLFAYIASLPLAAGKKIPFDLVSFREFNLLTFRPYGISADVIVTVGDACVLLMAFVILQDIFISRAWAKYRDTMATGLFFFFTASVVATTFGSLRPEISYLHTLFLLKPLIVYWYLIHQVRLAAVYRHGLYIIVAALFLESIITLMQVIKQGPIGSVLELAPDYIPYDTSSDSGQIFRPVGTFYHANTLAHFLLPLLFFILPFLFISIPGIHSPMVLVAGVVGLGTFFLTQSRSAWISFFVGFIVYLALVEKVWRLPLVLKKEAKRVISWCIVPIFIVTLVFVVPRIVRTSYTLDRYGSFQTRILLLEEAGMAAREHPVFGVGLEMDLFFMYLRSIHRRVTNGVVFFFPEPVHNGYMRLFLQVGLLGTAGFIATGMLIAQLMRKQARVSKTTAYRHIIAGAIGGVTAIAVNGTMQPLVPNLHDILLFIILSGACYFHKKSPII